MADFTINTLPQQQAASAIIQKLCGAVDGMCDREIKRHYPVSHIGYVAIPGGGGTQTEGGNINRGIVKTRRTRAQANFQPEPMAQLTVGNLDNTGDDGYINQYLWYSRASLSITAQTVGDYLTQGNANATNSAISGTLKERALREQMIAMEFEERLLDYTVGAGAFGIVNDFNLGADWIEFTDDTAFDIWKRFEGVDSQGNATGRAMQFRNGSQGAMRNGGAVSKVGSVDFKNQRVYFDSLPPDLLQGDYCYRYNSAISTGAIANRDDMLERYTLSELLDASNTLLYGLDYSVGAPGANFSCTNADNFGAITQEGFVAVLDGHMRRAGVQDGTFVCEFGPDVDRALRAAQTAQNVSMGDNPFGLVESFRFAPDRAALTPERSVFVRPGEMRVIPKSVNGTPSPNPYMRDAGELSGITSLVMTSPDPSRLTPNAPDGRTWKSMPNQASASAQWITRRNLFTARRDLLLRIEGITYTPAASFLS